ncbi:hypothetical protein TUM12370_24220 [Salmonella enterica subsp. enterica serovar Choleraesuis]|nr:hypothetical protein TUM12370_24220 [Salmonella enterica subsp. enterica serovar Choleraesuis]
MPYAVELWDAKGKVIYNTATKNYSLISRQRIIVPSNANGVTIPLPGTPGSTIPFFRVDGAYRSGFVCAGGIQGNNIWVGQVSDSGESVPVIIYAMGVGTTGQQPDYGAVVRDEAGKITWSSLDNPLFLRDVAVTSAHANPGTNMGINTPVAVNVEPMGWATRSNLAGSALIYAMGFNNGLWTTPYGNTNGSGAWSWAPEMIPLLTRKTYIDTSYMD